MPVLIFNADDVRRVVEHSLRNRQSDTTPSVLLVHDHGVYLMSNGRPRDIVSVDAEDRINPSGNEGRSFVAYAQGCHPEHDADWYETSRQLVGGDDFGELLPWATELKAALDRGANTIALEVTETSIEILKAAP
jgi:DUF3085 family protein